MPYRNYQRIQTIAYVITMLLMFASFLIVIRMQTILEQNINRNYRSGLINQTYNRATNCFAATNPIKRTPEYTRECYDKAEAATGSRVDRYGD